MPGKILGGFLKTLRVKRGWTLEDLSRASGLPSNMLELYENQPQKVPANHMYKLVHLLATTHEDIDKFDYFMIQVQCVIQLNHGPTEDVALAMSAKK